MVKERQTPHHFMMMIFLHHCHLLLHLLFSTSVAPFCVCGCVMKATGSTVACIIWSKRTAQHSTGVQKLAVAAAAAARCC
jgi:hypothetical protein